MSSFTQEDRLLSIRILKQRLTPKEIRKLIPGDLEKIIAKVEKRDGLLHTKVQDEYLAEILIDLSGSELMRNREVRELLVKSTSQDELIKLHGYKDTPPARGKNRAIEEIISRTWKPGKSWPLFFTKTFGFPQSLAGNSDGSEPPAFEEFVPFIPLPELHDWQKPLRDKIISVIRNKANNRAILSLPTGSGKTRVAVEAIVSELRKGSIHNSFLLWIAQSDELCEQAMEAFRQVWLDQCTREAFNDSSYRPNSLKVFRLWSTRELPSPCEDGIIIASIQKLSRICKEIDEYSKDLFNAIGVVFIDEAHHSIASSYSAVFNTLGLGTKSISKTPVIGLTATPYRVNEEERKRLVSRFNRNLITPDWKDPVTELKKRLVLANMIPEKVVTERKYELTPQELQQATIFFDIPKAALIKIGKDYQRNFVIIDRLLKIPQEEQVLFFGCSVENAQAIALLLRRKGKKSAVITADTPPSLRRQWIEDFRKNNLQFLCNFGVLTTGFDAPKVSVVAIARPTTSVLLYEQMVGRGMRGPMNGGTEDCLIIDFVDVFKNFQEPMSYRRYADMWR